MKIKDVLEETQSGLNIPRLQKGLVVSVKDGESQLLRLKDPDSDLSLSVFIKCDNLHVPAEKIVGKYVEFVAGPPRGGKPVGLTFKLVADKPRIVVTEGATMKISDYSEEREIPKEVPHPAQPTQLTEPEDQGQADGPSDKIIVECFYERLHILKILQRENELNGSPFTMDAMYPMTTSIIIEASRAGKKILPAAMPTKKKKFDSYEKPAHESPKSPVSSEHPIVEHINNSNGEDWYSATDAAGAKFKDILLDRDRRTKAIQFMFKNKTKNLEDKPKLMEARDHLLAFFRGADRTIQHMISVEAMMQDQAEISGLTDEDALIDLTSAAAMKFQGDLKMTNMPGIASLYFKAPQSERDVR